jgi:hypothetical protein
MRSASRPQTRPTVPGTAASSARANPTSSQPRQIHKPAVAAADSQASKLAIVNLLLYQFAFVYFY